MTLPQPEKYWVPALDRAAAVLDAVNRSPRGLRPAEVARALGLPKSTLHNLLLTMLALGLLARDAESGRITMGLRMYEWGAGYVNQTDLVDLFHRLAAESVRECHETVQLAVLDRTEVVYLAKQEPEEQTISLVSAPGRRLPAHATALGKALLARLPEAEVVDRYRNADWPQLTQHTISSLPELLRELNVIRTDGVAVDKQEAAQDLECVAAAVLDRSSRAAAAVSITALVYRLTGERRLFLRSTVTALAGRLSRQLGCGISVNGGL